MMFHESPTLLEVPACALLGWVVHSVLGFVVHLSSHLRIVSLSSMCSSVSCRHVARGKRDACLSERYVNNEK